MKYSSLRRILILIAISILLFNIQNNPRYVEASNKSTINVNSDSYVDPIRPDLNYGASSYLKVDSNRQVVSFIKFDLSILPLNADIMNATLWMYLDSKSSDATSRIQVHLIDDPIWDELRIDWNNKPNRTTLVYTNDTISFSKAWYSWNVSNAISKNLSTLSFEISGNDPTGEVVFASKETLFSPRLELYLRFNDTESPEIGSISFDPAVPSSEDETTVTARVSDINSGVKIVKLFYRVNNGVWKSLEMFLIDEIYQGSIPIQISESTVEFYILAVDNSENNSTSIIQEYLVVRPQYYSDLQDIYNDLLTRFDELTQKFDDLKIKADLERLNLDSLLKNYTSLQVLFLNVNESYYDMQKDYSTINREFNSIQFQLTEVQEDLLLAESQNNNFQVDIDNFKEEIEQLKSELFGVQGELYGNKEYLDSVLAQLNNTQAEFIDVSKDLSTTRTQFEDLSSEYNNINQYLIFWQLVTILLLISIIALLFLRRNKK